MLFKLIFSLVIGLTGWLGYAGYRSKTNTASTFLANMTDATAIIIGVAGLLLSLVVCFVVFGKKKTEDKRTAVGITNKGDKISQYYDAKWVSLKELESDKRFMFSTFARLPSVTKSGIIFRNEVVGGKLRINMYDPIHTLIIGSTGTGKTTLVIDPSIRIYAKTAEKPCMVITDPKGELLANHGEYLKRNGYRLEVLDLRKPFASTRWNPMDNAYMMYQRAHKLFSEVKVHKNGRPSDFGLKTAGNNFGAEWYEFQGVAYPAKQILEQDVKAKKQELIDEAENELREVCLSVIPIGKGDNASWDRGAQDFFYGCMLAMLEDSIIPDLGMTRERFNPYNAAKIATRRDPDGDNPFGTLKKYFQGRGDLSKAGIMANTVINSAATTAKGYLSVMQTRLSIFQDTGVCYLTSYNDMHFDDFVDQPTVLFIQCPDEKESRHCIATMCISQIYKKLVEIANTKSNLKLPKPVYFLLDEFANLPKIEKMDTYITVARSRRIFFELVIQSYSQLDDRYGKESANTIKSNCNIQMFIGTEDQQTREEFSKLCGNISLLLENKTINKNEKQKEGGESTSLSTQTVTRPLIYPDELGQLPKNEMVIKIFKCNPIRCKSSQWFAIPEFVKYPAPNDYHPARALDEEAIYYDIAKRNKKMIKSSTSPWDF